MEKYYFVGGKGAVISEIINILKEKNIAYEQVPEQKYGVYRVSQEQIDSVLAQGKKPYLINVAGHVENAISIPNFCSHLYGSALERVAVENGVELSAWQALVQLNDENRFKEYPYDVHQIGELVRYGYSHQEIDKVRAYDRAEKGVTPEEEDAAEDCISKMSVRNKLLVVTKLPHEKYSAVLDRLFWQQPVQNVVIFTTTGAFLYAGFADIAARLFMAGIGAYSLSFAFVEGWYNTETDVNRIVKFLSYASREKVKDGLL